MILTETNVMTVLQKDAKDRCEKFLAETVKVIQTIKPMKPYFVESYNPEDDEEKGLDAMEQLESLDSLIELNTIELFNMASICGTGFSRRRLNSLYRNLTEIIKLGDKFVYDYMPIRPNDALKFNNLITEILGHGSLLLIDLFNLETVKNGTDVVNGDFYKYCDKLGENYYKELTDELYTLAEENKVKLLVFDQYPEYEEPFYNKLEINIPLEQQEIFESNLTLKDVKSFLQSPNSDGLLLYKKVLGDDYEPIQ